MEERRKTPRLQEENEFTINIISGEENLSKEEILFNGKDISLYGAKIQGNIPLPVGTIVKLDITINNLQQKKTTIGKVKWNKFMIGNQSYEAGVEFINTPDETIQILNGRMQKDDTFIPEEEWSKLQEINKYEIASGEDAIIPEEEWSKLKEINKKEMPPQENTFIPEPEEDTFIPEEEWSKLQEINKKKDVPIAEPIKTTDTGATDMKKCRYCSRDIKFDAVKCDYCGRTLSGDQTERKVFL
ncbi:MAG: PilZ domain-containing protein [Smithella sp.]|jgi:hypothetical protein